MKWFDYEFDKKNVKHTLTVAVGVDQWRKYDFPVGTQDVTVEYVDDPAKPDVKTTVDFHFPAGWNIYTDTNGDDVLEVPFKRLQADETDVKFSEAFVKAYQDAFDEHPLDGFNAVTLDLRSRREALRPFKKQASGGRKVLPDAIAWAATADSDVFDVYREKIKTDGKDAANSWLCDQYRASK